MDFEIIAPTTPTRLPLIVHLPHASTHIPTDFRSQILLDDDALAAEHLKLADLHTDHLFSPLRDLRAPLFVNRVSRLLCDPERFLDETREEAARYGMGAVYLQTHDSRNLRAPTSPPRTARPSWIASTIRTTRPSPTSPPSCWKSSARSGSWTAIPSHPGPFYGRDPRVRSFMLEVRRDLFTDEATGQYLPEAGCESGSMGPHHEVFHHAWRTDFNAFLNFLTRDVRARSRKPGSTISREQALAWAEHELRREHPDWSITRVINYSEVLGSGVMGPRLCRIGEETLQRCWIAYVDDGVRGWLRSSTIILIDGGTGQILYFGSAYDEG